MRQQLLAGAMAVALATALMTSAMASGHGDRRGFHGSRVFHGGGFHAGHSGYRGPYYDGIAPFGHPVGFGPGYRTCSPDDYGYGYCGSTFTVG